MAGTHAVLRRLVLAVLAIGAVAASVVLATSVGDRTGSTSLARDGLRVGVAVNVAYGGEGELTLARRLGIRWVREEFRWSEIEPRPGTFDWTVTDRLLETTARQGVRVVPMLYSTPEWLSEDPLALPTDTAAYATFARAVVERYGPAGAFWRERPALDVRLAPRWYELWNEPFFEFFSSGGTDPAQYARMVRDAGAAVHAADPEVRVLMAADHEYTAPDGSTRNWVDDMFDAVPDLGPAFDGVAVHPYSEGRSPGTTAGLDRRYQFRRIEDIRANLLRRGQGRQRFWLTEIGWSTCTSRPICVGEAEQADHLRAMFRLVGGRYRGFVDAVFVYHQRDFEGRPRADKEGSFGLLRVDGSRKPSWTVVRRAVRDARR